MKHSFFFSLATLLVILLTGCSTDSGQNHTFIADTLPEDGGTITPPSGTFEDGSQVEIRAEPADGFLFERWEGDVTGDENPVTLSFFRDQQVTAVFTTAPFAAGGDGSMANPYRVSTIDDLQAIDDEQYLDKHFIQVSDIDASASAEFQHGSGFKHIGDQDTPFTGSYDGNGFVIRDLHLHIQRSGGQHTGIFGTIQNGRLENITVDNSEQLLKIPSDQKTAYKTVLEQSDNFLFNNTDLSTVRRIGGLVGFNDGGVILNCNFTGEVRAHISGTGSGLIGVNTGIIENSHFEGFTSGGRAVGLVKLNTGKIINSSADVNAVAMYTYGLVSLNYGEITDSFAHVDISGSRGSAGLAGTNEGGRIEASYATGEVRGSRISSGLVLHNSGEIIHSYSQVNVDIEYLNYDQFTAAGFVAENLENGIIEYSYAAGTITVTDGTADIGSVAKINEGTIRSTYWDSETFDLEDAVFIGNKGGATGLTTQQMIGSAAETHIPEFDWQTEWRTTDGYPVLRWQSDW